jgi:hypothetical protein
VLVAVLAGFTLVSMLAGVAYASHEEPSRANCRVVVPSRPLVHLVGGELVSYGSSLGAEDCSPPSTSPPGIVAPRTALPVTGSDPSQLLALAIVLVTFGLAATAGAAASRRHHRSARELGSAGDHPGNAQR